MLPIRIMKTTDRPPQRVDQALGRAVTRFWAIVAFMAAMAGGVFGIIVLIDGQVIPGLLLLALGTLFLWLGRRAWRDRAGLGDLLNRDFEGPGAGRSS